MVNEIADGEIHPLNEELAYILLDERTPFYKWDVQNLKEEMFKKYFRYLSENGSDSGRFWFILRTHPHTILSSLTTLAIKFERVLNDGLK